MICKRIFVFFIVSILFWNSIQSQSMENEKFKPKELTIGDQVPLDFEIKDIINYKNSIVKISDFKGKLLILDFWATWCSPCIAFFPRMNLLQDKFGDQVLILPIAYEDKQLVSDFINKRKNITGSSILTATGDKVLNRLFKHTTLPHYVWIDGEGKVVAITSSEEVNEENIRKALVGNTKDLVFKRDPFLKYIYGLGNLFFAPSIQTINTNSNKVEIKRFKPHEFLFYSILTRYTEGAIMGSDFDSLVVSTRNSTIYLLYKIAFWKGHMDGFSSTKNIIDIPDTLLRSRITMKDREGKGIARSQLEATAWHRENCFSFEIKVPRELKDLKYDMMLDELNRYFGVVYGIEGVKERRKREYLALTCLDCKKIISTMGDSSFIKSDKYSIKMVNRPVSSLLGALFVPLQEHALIVDETGISSNIDIEINCNLSDLNSLNKELKKYGLHLEEKEKVMEVGVIRMKME